MCRVHDVADFFIDSALNDPENNMTNLRINKLLYFAQGWSLARLGRPLVEDAIEAWTHGPVVPAIYQRLKTSGRDKVKGLINEDYADHFTLEEQRLLIDVLHAYDRYSTNGLVTLTHAKGSPWRKAMAKGRNTVIPQSDMKAYFLQQGALPTFQMPQFRPSDFIGRRDEMTGNYVLPKEWDDDEP